MDSVVFFLGSPSQLQYGTLQQLIVPMERSPSGPQSWQLGRWVWRLVQSDSDPRWRLSLRGPGQVLRHRSFVQRPLRALDVTEFVGPGSDLGDSERKQPQLDRFGHFLDTYDIIIYIYINIIIYIYIIYIIYYIYACFFFPMNSHEMIWHVMVFHHHNYPVTPPLNPQKAPAFLGGGFTGSTVTFHSFVADTDPAW